MEELVREHKALLITAFSLFLFATFLYASYIGVRSVIEVFNEKEIEQIMGSEIRIEGGATTVDAGKVERIETGKEIDGYYDYRVLSGKHIGRVGTSDRYAFYLSWPVSRGLGVVTQCFTEDHNGIDIAHYSFPDVLAAAPGEVIFAGCHEEECPEDGAITGGSGLARTVMIEHDYGFITVYGHLNNIYVQEGDVVKRSQIIGQMGKSGTVHGEESGVHVHFSLLTDRNWGLANPSDYLLKATCIENMPDPEAFY